MLELRPFHAADVADLQLQAQQAAELVSVGDWRVPICDAAASGPAWTAWWDGRPIGAGGFSLRWAGRAAAWCVVAADVPQAAWLAIHRAVLARMAQLPALGVRRLEAEVLCGWAPGIRWLRLLGFACEGQMRGYGPDGADYLRYARVRS